MERGFDERFRILSRQGQAHMRSGNLHLYSAVLKEMAHILHSEGKRVDQIKVLMLAFYIDLSGVCERPYIDDHIIAQMRCAIAESQMDLHHFRELFLETARRDATPRHTLKVSDTLFVLEKVLNREYDDANRILETVCPDVPENKLATELK